MDCGPVDFAIETAVQTAINALGLILGYFSPGETALVQGDVPKAARKHGPRPCVQ